MLWQATICGLLWTNTITTVTILDVQPATMGVKPPPYKKSNGIKSFFQVNFNPGSDDVVGFRLSDDILEWKRTFTLVLQPVNQTIELIDDGTVQEEFRNNPLFGSFSREENRTQDEQDYLNNGMFFHFEV